MFRKILIANRGEIAVRIIRACKELGIKTVAVYSTEDKESLHVKLADTSICIGGARSKDSYLNINNIITAATNLKCDGIHPGYGFLSENADFARIVQQNNMKFIGPSADIIEKMGDKISAIALMKENGVETVPGSKGEIKSFDELKKVVDKISYPVLIKASGGGGGRGMRRVYRDEDLKKEFEQAKKEALSAFNNDSMYVEKLIVNPKHIEVQILADNFGNIVSVGERDCSIQRKNQKMIEESPCSSINNNLREKLYNSAIKAARACNYNSAGTVEFVVEGDKFYFIEMNTRIQVEHPVTEMVSGVDLIKEQIRIAAGNKLSLNQSDIKIKNHSIECRINAENPLNNFSPEAGDINFINYPGGYNIRFDTFIYNGAKVSPYYDSMIGKLIVVGETRAIAIKKMRAAIEELIIDGVNTNALLQYAILFNKEFVIGDYNTSFIEKNLDNLLNVMNVGE